MRLGDLSDFVARRESAPVRAGSFAPLMAALRIIAFSVLAAVTYGVLHDQVTARVCVEYFTIGHPPLFPTTSPTLLALGWGVVATWWVGLPLGVLLAAAARLGPRVKLTVRDLRRPVLTLLLVMGASALLAGIVGAVLASAGKVWLVEPLATRLPADRHVPFLADLWAHTASYAVGMLGGLVLVGWTWRHRRARPSTRTVGS